MSLFYVQTQGDTFVRHIHDVEPTQWDEDNFCRVAKLTPEQVEQFGIHQLKLVTPPYYNPATQAREHGPALLIDGIWTQTYIVSELDPETSAEKIKQQWDVVRADRNVYLSATDWWVTKAVETGESLTDEQQAYRQALRDITTQDDPFNIVWPEPPVSAT